MELYLENIEYNYPGILFLYFVMSRAARSSFAWTTALLDLWSKYFAEVRKRARRTHRPGAANAQQGPGPTCPLRPDKGRERTPGGDSDEGGREAPTRATFQGKLLGIKNKQSVYSSRQNELPQTSYLHLATERSFTCKSMPVRLLTNLFHFFIIIIFFKNTIDLCF